MDVIHSTLVFTWKPGRGGDQSGGEERHRLGFQSSPIVVAGMPFVPVFRFLPLAAVPTSSNGITPGIPGLIIGPPTGISPVGGVEAVQPGDPSETPTVPPAVVETCLEGPDEAGPTSPTEIRNFVF